MPRHSVEPRRARLTWGRRLAGALGLFVATVLVLGTAGTLHVARALDEADRIDLSGSLRSTPPTKTENYLLVGSDTREGADPSSPDFGGIGDESSVDGRRSDTMMVLRYDPKSGQGALLSLPRDLWVEVAGTGEENRLNSAYAKSEETLIQTVTQELGIPVDHYVEVDFSGFKELVDAIGGVNVWFELPTRDKNTGLRIEEPGCYRLDGLQALQYVRSRHYQQRLNGDWIEDPSSDFGRMSRQQDFIRRSLGQAVAHVADDPVRRVTELVDLGLRSVRVDDELDLLGLGERFAQLGSTQLATYVLPAEPDTIDGNSVLILDDEAAAPVLAFFRGEPPPLDEATTTLAPAPGTETSAPTTVGPVLPPTQAPLGTVPADPRQQCV